MTLPTRKDRVVSALRTRADRCDARRGCARSCRRLRQRERPSSPAAQPTETPTTPSPPTPAVPPAWTAPTPSRQCAQPADKVVWGKGAATSLFQPVSVTVCQYDAKASGQDYATVSTKRTSKQAADLFALVNAPKPAARSRPLHERARPDVRAAVHRQRLHVLSYTAETFGCRRLVATSLEGQQPGELPAPATCHPS